MGNQQPKNVNSQDKSPCDICIIRMMCNSHCEGLVNFIEENLPYKCTDVVLNYLALNFRETTMRHDIKKPGCGVGLYKSENGEYEHASWVNNHNGYSYIRIDKKTIVVHDSKYVEIREIKMI